MTLASGKRLPWIVGAVLLAVGAAVAALAPLRDWTEAIEESLQRMSILQGMLAAGIAATIAMALIVGRAVRKRLQLD